MIKSIICGIDRLIATVAGWFRPVLELLVRLWAAQVFFKAGLTKIGNWNSTLYLFREEYSVPLLPYKLAAFMGTAVELLLPPLLVLGLFSRGVALILFAFNAIAVISYPLLWERGFYDHQLWGLMLLITVIYGPGKWSVDAWLARKSN